MSGLDSSDEEEEGCGVGGDTKVRPGCEMELGHNAFLTAATLQEWRREEQAKEGWNRERSKTAGGTPVELGRNV